jgi:hypothetical protein
MKGFIRTLILLAVLAAALPASADEGDVNWNSGPPPGREQSEAPDNYLITIITYPQLRGSECDDPYPTGDTLPVNYQYKERGIAGVYSGGTVLGLGSLQGCAFQVSPSIHPNRPEPTFDFWVKVDNHLSVTVTAVLTQGLTIYNLPQSKAGDGYTYYGDNTITIDDYNACMTGGTFGSAYGDSAYKEQCDADGDGAITIAEYNVIVGNFGQSGAAPPW